MGEGTADVSNIESPRELELEVEEIRDEMTDVVRELDRRRHDLFDARLQLRKHALALGIGTVSLVGVVSGVAALAAWRARRRRRPLAMLRSFQNALARMIAHPDNVARPQSGVGGKILTALALAAAGSLVKAGAARLLPAETRLD